MIKRIKIDNFKSLNDFTIDLKPLTVVVGNNAMGKSSILQAIAFLANCTVDDFGIILERRNWTVSNVKSRVGNANNCYECVREENILYISVGKAYALLAEFFVVPKNVFEGEVATKAFMIDEVSGVLNNIEYFAMNFAHGVADDSVVYRSLHQSYIDIMQLLYFNISNLNNSSSDKYYLNAIELYNKWKIQKDKDTNEKKMMDMTREAKNKGTIVNCKQ